VISIAVSLFVFSVLVSIPTVANEVLGATASSTRVATHNKASLVYPIPMSYKQRIQSLPHVEAVVAQSWFGGIYHEVYDQFPNLAVDPDQVGAMWPDWGISKQALDEWNKIRTARLVAPNESEVWGDIHNVQDDAQRGAYYADVRLKLAPGADADALIRRIADDPRINLQAETEAEYYKDQSVVANQMRVLGMVVAIIMAVGAIFGAMNTMYAAVSARTTEIGTLRALGFAPYAVMTSFLLESIVLAVVAGAIGIILALPINGLSTTFGNFVTFSSLAFSFRVTFAIVIEALIFAAFMGMFGGWLPARQAMRMPVVDTLRSV
jgi:cell division protein FtsX